MPVSPQKKFGGKWHHGKTIFTDVNTNTNENMWHVACCDDGDGEDFSAREMAGALVSAESEDEDGGTGQMKSDSDSGPGSSGSEHDSDT